MFKSITRLFSNNNNSKSNSQGSFLRLGGNFECEIDKELMTTIVSWTLGISMAGGAAYGFSNMILSPNTVEPENLANQSELVEKSTNLKQNTP